VLQTQPTSCFVWFPAGATRICVQGYAGYWYGPTHLESSGFTWTIVASPPCAQYVARTVYP
jgi:hypothetical protein